LILIAFHLVKFLPIFLLCTATALAGELSGTAAMNAAADHWLAGLNPEQRTKAALHFTNNERENFRYTPRNRAGLPLKEMTEAQRVAAMKLLESALSEKGKLKVTQIMLLEGILAELEKSTSYRDAGKYFVAVFGQPGDPKGWGWRFEGHHMSLNFTVVEGRKVTLTPSFLGSNPAEVREGPHAKLRVLAAEEDLARSLVIALHSAGKSHVVFSDKPPGEILSGESRKATALDSVGLTASEMSETQRLALMDLIEEYTGRYRSEFAKADMAKIEKAGIENIRFGWSGGFKPGDAYYYRIQGPTFLIEAVNVQNNANHIHAVWRDLEGDFGRDILAEHLHDH
jgi:hypothetical protein